MNKSESITEIAKAMCKAQGEMGGANKSTSNSFFKSKYADLSEVIKAIKEPFANNGLSYVQFPIEENGRVGIETILMHESGEFLSNSFTVQLSKQDAQGAGSAITYCRRYGLQAVAGIPSEDDDGNHASQGNKQQAKPQPKARSSELSMVMSEGSDINTTQYWRSLSQEEQQREWMTIDKESQKHLKKIMAEHPGV